MKITKEILEYKSHQSDKRQIVLTHTSRNYEDYLTSLKERYNGDYDKIPHFIIKKDGEIIQVMDDKNNTRYFGGEKEKSNLIIVCLENYGWVRKNPLSGNYLNWIGDSCDSVYEKSWRGHIFWDEYSESQVNALEELVRYLFKTHDIKNNFVGHNVKVDKVEYFNGVTTVSNYFKKTTKLSPAFNFEEFKSRFNEE